jgi:hypothetical protein
MVRNLVRKGGVPAVAYSSTDATALEPCNVILLCSETKTNAQFTALLEAPISIHGIDDKQTFVLRFDGDNLVPGRISLDHTKIPPTDELVDKIAREGQPELRVLSLTLKTPCSVWYPRTLSSAVSRFDTPSHELVDLTKTMEIRILFDTKWLGSNLSRLRSVSERSSQLSGVPVVPGTIYTQLYVQADWSILNFVEEAEPEGLPVVEVAVYKVVPSVEDAAVGASSFKDVLDDAPPSYAQVPSKRSRNGKSSSRTQHRRTANVFP